jgi:hypothetical protein
MLEGKFKTLFDDSKVRFNANDGSFTIRNEEKGRIIVKGEGERKYWTEKALIRAGYAVVDSKSTIVVEVSSALNASWKCYTLKSNDEFNSIYNLISWIREHNFIF